jgi:hypothetical protein
VLPPPPLAEFGDHAVAGQVRDRVLVDARVLLGHSGLAASAVS